MTEIENTKFDLLIRMVEQLEQNMTRSNGINEQRFQELKGEIKDLRGELKEEIKDLRGEVKDIRGELKEIRLELRDIRTESQKEKEKLQEVYESRDRVSIAFTRAWTIASFFIALIASTIVLVVAKTF